MASEFRGDFISLASAGRLINPVDNLDDMVLPDDRTAIVREFAVILNGIQEQLQNTVIIIHFTNTDAVAWPVVVVAEASVLDFNSHAHVERDL